MVSYLIYTLYKCDHFPLPLPTPPRRFSQTAQIHTHGTWKALEKGTFLTDIPAAHLIPGLTAAVKIVTQESAVKQAVMQHFTKFEIL